MSQLSSPIPRDPHASARLVSAHHRFQQDLFFQKRPSSV